MQSIDNCSESKNEKRLLTTSYAKFGVIFLGIATIFGITMIALSIAILFYMDLLGALTFRCSVTLEVLHLLFLGLITTLTNPEIMLIIFFLLTTM